MTEGVVGNVEVCIHISRLGILKLEHVATTIVWARCSIGSATCSCMLKFPATIHMLSTDTAKIVTLLRDGLSSTTISFKGSTKLGIDPRPVPTIEIL